MFVQLWAFVFFFLVGCVENKAYTYVYTLEDSAQTTPGDVIETVPDDDDLNRPVCNEVAMTDLPDVFDPTAVYEIFLVMSDDVAAALDSSSADGDDWGREYELGNGGSESPRIEEVWLIELNSKDCAKLENVEAWLAGESTFDYFDRGDGTFGIPNISFKTGEDTLPGGYQDLRLNNGMASGVQRECIALTVASEYGYPAPQCVNVLVQSSWWNEHVGEGTWAVYSLVERYKEGVFERELPGTLQAWEWVGGLQPDMVDYFTAEECQWTASGEDCDNDQFADAVDDLWAVRGGAGWYTEASEVWRVQEYLEYKCLSYYVAAGDDCERNGNNCVIAQSSTEPAFGGMLPYSQDITFGQDWYPDVTYDGWSRFTQMCKRDPECRPMELEQCLGIVEEMRSEVRPDLIAEEVCDREESLNWWREGDEDRCGFIIDWLQGRPDEAQGELEELVRQFEEHPVPDTGSDDTGDTGEYIDTGLDTGW